MSNKSLFQRWFPASLDRVRVAAELDEFYRTNVAYHKMTSTDDKALHPQSQFLRCLVRDGGVFAEVGCGGGAISSVIGEKARVVGVDFSLLALAEAKKSKRLESVFYVNGRGENLPLQSDAFDGCYAFEVLEHVWDPVQVCAEMVRVVKPGGFILISVPLFFSLDLHLAKRPLVRLAEMCFASGRMAADAITGKPYRNVRPDLGGAVYPDCDLITAISPGNFAGAIGDLGCEVVFRDTTYMCAHRNGSGTDLAYQKNTAGKLVRDFGDHLLLLALKK